MTRSNFAYLICRLLTAAALCTAVACSDDGGDDADPDPTPDPMPAMNPDPMPEMNPDPMPEMNPDMMPDMNPDPDPTMAIEECQAACTAVAECPGIIELCGDLVDEVEAGCQDVCAEDEAARPQIAMAGGLPCEVVEPIAIDSFGLDELCGEADLCADVTCDDGTFCDDNGDLVTVSGGACDEATGECVFDNEDITACDEGLVCVDGACIEDGDLCADVACPPPAPTCDGDVAVSFDGDGVCVEGTGECDFSNVEFRLDCTTSDQVCQGGECVTPDDDDTIYALQDEANPDHPEPETAVQVNNVFVTANIDGFLFVQEPNGGPFSGIFVEEGELDITNIAAGDAVNIAGTYTENEGNFSLEGLSTINASTIEVIGQGELPVPQVVTVAELAVAETAEQWESVLVQINDVVVDDANPDGDRDFGEFGINGLRVDDLLFEIAPDPVVGSAFESIAGILNFSFGNFKLEPRSEADVIGYEPNLCVDVVCEPIAPFCDGNTRVSVDGNGICVEDTGECDFAAVETRTECDGQICLGGECIDDDGGRLVLSEVYYDAPGGDNELEWVEIFNGTDAAIDMTGFTLANAGSSYAAVATLSGTIPAGGCFVIGGPTSNDTNGNPTFDQSIDFSPDLQNSGGTADAVALFDVGADDIGNATPLDAVIYGTDNTNNLIDETGNPGGVDVGNAPDGNTIERINRTDWQFQATPTPNDCDILIID